MYIFLFSVKCCLIFGACALLFYACTSAGAIHTGEQTVGFNVDTVVVLTREPCFGACPAYRITLYADGTIQYHGESNVMTIGPAWTVVSSAVVYEVRNEILTSGFDILAKDCCDCQDVTDLPTAVLRVTLPGREIREIRHYHGCDKAPGWLFKLEEWLDRKLRTEEFIETESERGTLDIRSREVR